MSTGSSRRTGAGLREDFEIEVEPVAFGDLFHESLTTRLTKHSLEGGVDGVFDARYAENGADLGEPMLDEAQFEHLLVTGELPSVPVADEIVATPPTDPPEETL